jgi:hypothetical protein
MDTSVFPVPAKQKKPCAARDERPWYHPYSLHAGYGRQPAVSDNSLESSGNGEQPFRIIGAAHSRLRRIAFPHQAPGSIRLASSAPVRTDHRLSARTTAAYLFPSTLCDTGLLVIIRRFCRMSIFPVIYTPPMPLPLFLPCPIPRRAGIRYNGENPSSRTAVKGEEDACLQPYTELR